MNTTCFFKDQLVYLKTDRLGRLFHVISDSTAYGVTWCMDPATGLTVALETCNLELAPRSPERMLATALDDERTMQHATGCWFLVAGACLVLGAAVLFYYLKQQ